MNREPWLLRIGITCFVLFVMVSAGIVGIGFVQFDLRSMAIIQQLVPQFADTALSFFSLLGSFEITTFLLVLLLYIQKKIHGLVVLGWYGISLCIELVGKNILYHPGPPHIFSRYDLGFTFPTSLYQTGNSFPSGHMLRTAFLVTIAMTLLFLSHRLSKWKKGFFSVILLVIFFIMLISRVSLGEHWLSDVLAGATLGIGSGLLSLTMQKSRTEKTQSHSRMIH